MEDTAHRAIAIVGVGAILPDAPNAPAFWNNVKNGRYSISDVSSDRWNPADYYDPDPAAPDKTYSKIGGWVRDFEWEPMKWHLPIPPRVANEMDITQRWAVACTREALEDYGYPKRPLNIDRTAVILGNAMAGEKHYLTSLRVYFPEYARELESGSNFAALPEPVRRNILAELHDRIGKRFAPVTEDTMPGELANCMAGRIANLYNFHGPNFVCDAACASAMAAISAAVEGLIANEFDIAISGGVDRNMGAPTFVKFCKIGALSATGTRPYAEGADGFVMGEGAAIFLLKRLADAEHDEDKIYAVLRGIGGSSDGKGKGITAPNPIGQKLCVERAWENAGLSPATATLIEGHGTSTRVGDVVEAQNITEILGEANLPSNSVALGSVKSNIGHLKSAAGAAGILKTAFALRDKVLPPSLNCDRPSPDIDFAHSPVYVNRELKPWEMPSAGVRRAGVSAFGFGGTNFHVVMEEHIPGRLNGNGKRSTSVPITLPAVDKDTTMHASSPSSVTAQSPALSAMNEFKAPLRGAFVIGADSDAELATRLRTALTQASAGISPAPSAPAESDLRAPQRVAIDYADAPDLAKKLELAIKALEAKQPSLWKAIQSQGIFRGSGAAPKVAFLYTGQGSQYVNMLRTLRETVPMVAETFDEADRVMTPLLGKPLSKFIFVDETDEAAVAKAEEDLRQTAITQPAILATDLALTRLLAAYGVKPDMTMGHSLGEYGALVASGALPFADALEAVSARGREMTRVSVGDNGKMVAVFAPLAEIERIIKSLPGYLVIANVNSEHQAVVGGASSAVDRVTEVFLKAGFNAVSLPVSHAFHTSIVAPASEPLREVLTRMHLTSPQIPIVTNVSGEFYPAGPNVAPKMVDILARQIASPVQFVKGLRTLYGAGARVLVEVGPKKALQGFAEDVLGTYGDVLALFTNHPKVTDAAAFNQALCGLYAAGLGRSAPAASAIEVVTQPEATQAEKPVASPSPVPSYGDRYAEVGKLFAEVVERGWEILRGNNPERNQEPVTISGAALGLPGTERVFDDTNVARILRGDQFITPIPTRFRDAMAGKHVTRLVKSETGATFEEISDAADVIKLAGRAGAFDLEKEFGVPSERIAALDRCTSLAIAAGLEALRDAGIPLVRHYKSTSKGTKLPNGWGLPDPLRDDTGVIFASAFPGLDAFAEYISGYHVDKARREQLSLLESLLAGAENGNGSPQLRQAINHRISELRAKLEAEPYVFDRRFLFRCLSMGHSQFAELIGARGPNTQVNAACASTSQAIAISEDWIRAGRCKRVVIVSSDDATSDNLMEWLGAGFLASGAAATDEVVENAAIPFDRRRHGLILGMGAAALVVESAESMRERGVQPICEVLSAVTANSAFHGTRLDVDHIGQVMEELISHAEVRSGISRRQIAPHTVFVSHETYTPARGGSASAEIFALRKVFGDAADQIVIANTKGMTGHAMGTGIEEVVAVKALETGCVPPVVNFKEVDPELGQLTLSKGGSYPVEYALRLGAGFGSQISMALMRWVKTSDGFRRTPNELGFSYRITDPVAWNAWLSRISGYSSAELEVVNRTLRVQDQGAPRSVIGKAVAVAAAAPEQPVALPPPTVTPTLEIPTAAPTPSVTDSAPQAALIVEAVLATPETAAAPSVPIQAAIPEKSVKERVLELVVEKTGYPAEMLDLDLDLEADLGVDTVKQAEIFTAIRSIYNIPRDENRKLRDYPTLAHVIRFVEANRPDLVSTTPQSSAVETRQGTIVSEPAPAPQAATPGLPAKATEPEKSIKERILELVVEKTGYPAEMLDLELDLEADLGVDTVKQAEIFTAIRGIYNIPRDESRKLRDYPTLAHVVRFVEENRPDLGAVEPQLSTAEQKIDAATREPQPVVEPPVLAQQETQPETSVEDRILDLVVEKTGYPKEMLDLDLDLEADLGVDTVKQAEIFTSIRAIYNIPRDENRKLRDYPTLAHVIRFVHENRPDRVPAPAVAAVSVVPAEMPIDKAIPVTTPQTAAEPATAVTDNSVESITAKIVQIVAEKTGYPAEMLDLDLDLEADLGVDTVKQAEMFAAVRAAYNIPRDENLKLRDFPTLAHVIRFAQERMPRIKPNIAAEPEQHSPVAAPATLPTPVAGFDATNKVARRVPVPALRPPIDLCKTTKVELKPGTRVVLMPDAGGVAEALTSELHSRGVEVLRMDPAQDLDALTETLNKWLADGPLQGVYWLSALDDEGPIGRLTLESWHSALRVRVKALFATMRALYEQVATPGTFLVSATRLGGQHGYDDHGAVAPMGGAVAGFTKTYERERPEAHVKVVDFEPDLAATQIAATLIEETLHDPGAVEIGYKHGLRWTVALREQPAEDGQPGLKLGKDSVFVITGAAGSIVSAITADLASASGGTFYLLDLAPEPDPSNPDLKRFTTDKDGLKRDLFARIQARGERATPALVEKELAALERAQAALNAIEAVHTSGGTPHYFSLNLADTEAVAKVIDTVRQRHGRIDVLLHAAGLERSHFLPAKDPREFDLVFDVKADGWFNLIHAVGDMPLGATVAFSSIAGRFGNAGQTDYSAANDLLCKYASSMRKTNTRAIAIDWTAWGGIGMATRGSIPKMMELAGIDMLQPEAGVPLIRRELTVGGTRGEVLIAERLGVLLNEWDESGGVDQQALASVHGPMVGKVTMGIQCGLTIETTLDPAQQPFLHDHCIGGTPVLPGVMGIEAFAEAALCAAPGWRIDAIEDINFLAPFKFYRNGPRTVTLRTSFELERDTLVANCELVGKRLLPTHTEPQETTHFTARVLLKKGPPLTAKGATLYFSAVGPVHSAQVYQIYFHGPAYQVVEHGWWDGKRVIAEMAKDLPPNHHPQTACLALNPRLIELCFQTAGLWEMGALSRLGLPQHVERISWKANVHAGTGPLYSIVTPHPEHNSFDAEVLDAQGNRYLAVEGYSTAALPEPIDADALKPLQSMLSPHEVLAA